MLVFFWAIRSALLITCIPHPGPLPHTGIRKGRSMSNPSHGWVFVIRSAVQVVSRLELEDKKLGVDKDIEYEAV
jgi:hypothetical protein